VVIGLLGGEGATRGLRVESQLLRPWTSGAKAVCHAPRPQAARCAELRDLFDEIVVRVEEKRDALAELVDVQAGLDRGLNICRSVCDGERDFLDGRGTCLSNVVAANRNRVPLGEMPLAEGENIGDDSQRRARRINVCAARDVLLQDVVL